MSKIIPIITLLARPRNLIVFVVVGAAFFIANYYAMKNLPGSNGYMCTVGGNLTPGNIAFSALLSVLAGLIAAGIAELVAQKKRMLSLKVGSASALGMIAGTLTVFCAVCTLPALSLFGASISLTILTENEKTFKIASLVLMGAALYLLNRQLKKECLFGSCKT